MITLNKDSWYGRLLRTCAHGRPTNIGALIWSVVWRVALMLGTAFVLMIVLSTLWILNSELFMLFTDDWMDARLGVFILAVFVDAILLWGLARVLFAYGDVILPIIDSALHWIGKRCPQIEWK